MATLPLFVSPTAHSSVARATFAESGPNAYLPNAPGRPFETVTQETPSDGEVTRRAREEWGPRIFDQASRFFRGPVRWFQDRLFGEMLADEAVKKRMIAFLDVAASRPPEELVYYFNLYFPPGEIQAAGLLGRVLRSSSLAPDSMVRWGIRQVIRGMYERFFAGETPVEAVATARRLQKKGMAATINVVTEHVVSVAESERYLAKNIELMRLWAAADDFPAETAGHVPVRHLSTKLSALSHRFDPLATDQVVREAGGRLRTLFQEAKASRDQGKPFLIDVDPEDRYTRDLYYRVFWTALTDPSLGGWDDAGVVVQAYLGDSEEVLLRQIDLARRTGKKIQVRLVKGAYHRFEEIRAARKGWPVPVFSTQEETDRNFARLIELALMNHEHIRIEVATHNLRDIAVAESIRESLNLPREVLEFGFLKGVGEPAAASVVKNGGIARIYTPYGTPAEGMPYEVRRLDEVTPTSAIGETHLSGSWKAYYRRMESRTSQPPVAAELPFKNEPDANFGEGAVRQAMEEALRRRETGRLPAVTPLIGTGHIPFNVSRSRPSINPANLLQVVGNVMEAGSGDVDGAIRAAQAGFREWSSWSQELRSSTLRVAAEIAKEKRFEIAAAIVAEGGKPWHLAVADVDEGIDFLEAYAIDGLRESPDRAPLGVGVAISPFNFPFAIAMGEIAGGLALGNAMILKPANQTPVIGEYVVKILREAGVPPAAIQFLPGPGGVVGQKLVESEEVDFVVFTGSNETANRLMRTAAEHPSRRNGIKIVVAETGGKNPIIVDESADLDVAVEAILAGAFEMNGQRCSATSRVIVMESVAERLIERLVEGARSMVVGDPRRPETQLGPQIDRASLEKARRYIEIGKREATLAYEADTAPLGKTGLYLGPHIFVNVPRGARIAREEIFAPILSVLTAKTFGEAIEIANDVPYGLTAGLISRDPAHIGQFFREIEAGNAYVNRSTIGARVWEQPFGGAKDSGTGPKAGGRQYVARFGKPREERRSEGVLLQREWRAVTRYEDEELPGVSMVRNDNFLRETREAQREWARSSTGERIAVLERLGRLLSDTADTRGSHGGPVTGELRVAADRIGGYVESARRFLTPEPTLPLPGEINEEAHDWPLGVGLVWGYDDLFSDVIAATAAALLMGNAVVLPDTGGGRLVSNLFQKAGIRPALVPTLGSALLLGETPFDFVVSHGSRAAQVHKRVQLGPKPPVGFTRFIGVTDAPSDPWYLTRFANARTKTERTLRHGADLAIHTRNHV